MHTFIHTHACTHTHTHTQNITQTHIHIIYHAYVHLCWVVPCSITDVAAYDLAILLDSDTGLLHTTRSTTMFIFTISLIPMFYVSVTVTHVILSFNRSFQSDDMTHDHVCTI